MIPLYAFHERNEKIRIGCQYKLEGSFLILQFLVEDYQSEIEDFYPPTSGEKLAILYLNEDLWKTTCFEIFLKNLNSNDYYEFNFNSQGDWNLFYFKDYREREKNFKHTVTVSVQNEKLLNKTTLMYKFDIAKLDKLNFPCQVNLSSVIKTKSEISYWSQKHTGAKPDFHDSKNFSLLLDLNQSKNNKGKKSHG